MGLVQFALVFERVWNRSLFNKSCQPLTLFYFLLYSPRHTPFGLRAVLPLCDGKAQGPPSQLWGRTQQLGAGGVLYSKQGGPLGPFCHLVVLLRRFSRCCCCAPVGQHRRLGRSRLAQPAVRPASPPDPSAGHQLWCWWW